MTDSTSLTRFTDGSIASRQAALPVPLRDLHRAVLRRFLETGAAPTARWVRQAATELGLDASAVDELDTADAVHITNGVVAVAYPFSGIPTPHRVELDGLPAVHAMCAIDALGLPVMAGRDGRITSADPRDGTPIEVTAHGGTWSWTPAGAVVVAGRATGCGTECGSFEVMCPNTVFHASRASRRPTWPAAATSTPRSSARTPPSRPAASTSARCSARPDRVSLLPGRAAHGPSRRHPEPRTAASPPPGCGRGPRPGSAACSCSSPDAAYLTGSQFTVDGGALPTVWPAPTLRAVFAAGPKTPNGPASSADDLPAQPAEPADARQDRADCGNSSRGRARRELPATDLTKASAGAFTGHDREAAVCGGRRRPRSDRAARLPGRTGARRRRRRLVGDVPVRDAGLPGPAGGANVEAWLVTIAHRKAIDVTRAAARRAIPVAETPDHAPAAPADSPGADLDSDLADAVARLPAKQKQAVAYHYLAGLPYTDIAAILGGSSDAARRAAADGIATLRRAYAGAPPYRKESPDEHG